jgi:hypothetical protein
MLMRDWSDNAVSQNISPHEDWITDAERTELEIDAVKRTIIQLAEMPANAEGEPFISATHFDPEQLKAIQKILRDCLDWVSTWSD